MSETFLYKLTPARVEMVTEGPTPEEEQTVGEHFDYLTRLAGEGRVLIFGRTANNDETTFGIAILQVENEEEARSLMTNDPAVEGRVMHAELYPYRIAGMADTSAFPMRQAVLAQVEQVRRGRLRQELEDILSEPGSLSHLKDLLLSAFDHASTELTHPVAEGDDDWDLQQKYERELADFEAWSKRGGTD